MQLFRTDSNLGTVVKPRLEQQRANRQFGGAISGLQTTSHTQGTTLNQLGRQGRRLQGTSSQQYYMNYGRYYPAFGR